MTWGDVKLAALQTMYSNEGAVLTEDDINREYINAMPAKANEALQQIASVGRPSSSRGRSRSTPTPTSRR